MIYPERTYTNNPFVDNVIYYAKWIAMNCTIKDEEEALANETKESLYNGDLFIACSEGHAHYEAFKKIPTEILEKYIPARSNLDLYVDNPKALKVHLNHYDATKRAEILNYISELARTVYVDHFVIMSSYLGKLSPTWLEDNEALYNDCKAYLATYSDLFEIMPMYTRKRIVKTYLNNYDSTNLKTICRSLSNFEEYLETRTDTQIINELANISRAMCDVFSSHYEMMIERKYVARANDKWFTYADSIDTYRDCKSGTATYKALYRLFPQDELEDSLTVCLGSDAVQNYDLLEDVLYLRKYFDEISTNSAAEQELLNQNMREKYLSNYRIYIDRTVFAACNSGKYDYFDLVDFLPKETLKMILNTKIEEYTNLKVYEEQKAMLDSYLSTLPKQESLRIKSGITKDMIQWYPLNHVETNNYYRTLIGLPPIDKYGTVCVDTLTKTWNEKTRKFVQLGDSLVKEIMRAVPNSVYPESHWKQNICDFDAYDIGILEEYGIIDKYVQLCKGDINSARYKYLRHLADNKLDLYTCRKASKFDLIGVPIVDDSDAQKKFTDCYNINKDYILRTVYSDAYKFQSEYYDKFMAIFIIINTIMDMLSGITEMIIDREVFDYRCIKWIFESFGVPYYSEIPIKYLRAMLKNLNMLLKYKSSTKNMIDICRLFGFNDVRVFGYYLFRQRLVDPNTGIYKFKEHNDIDYDVNDIYVQDPAGNLLGIDGLKYTKLADYHRYINHPDEYMKTISYSIDGEVVEKQIIDNDKNVFILNKNYNSNNDHDFIPLKDSTYFKKIKANINPAEIKFIKVPIDDQLTEYKNDPNYIVEYDEIVYADEGDTWDGGLNHELLRQELTDYEFNAAKTKYISVETVTDLTEQAFQVTYFFNMLFDNLYSEEALTVAVPYLKQQHSFRFMDLVCYMFALMYLYNGLNDNIMYSPTQILYVKGYNFDEAINALMADPNSFTQPENPMEKEDIFDVNEMIEKVNYDYRKQFEGYKIKSFNLEADIDELDKWLQEYCQMSLDDFVVDDGLVNFDQIITLRQFFTLNNSYYQKELFKDNVYPIPYNQIIKYSYDYDIIKKEYYNDLDGNIHGFIFDNGMKMEVINDTDGNIFIMDYKSYITMPDNNSHTVLRNYIKDDTGVYDLNAGKLYYYDINSNTIVELFPYKFVVTDSKNRCVFSANALYKKNDDSSYAYIDPEEYPQYFSQYGNDGMKCRLIFGDYWIYDDKLQKWVIDLNKAYVLVTTSTGEQLYIPWAEAISHNASIDSAIVMDNCFIKHSDGHFIKFSETDYYREIKDREKNGENTEYVYSEEELYIEVSYETEESDIDLSGITHYYKKVSAYLYENHWVYSDDLYIYDNYTNSYIAEKDLISPNNCYFMKELGLYLPVINNLSSYHDYGDDRYFKNVKHILILDDNYDYDIYELSEDETKYSKLSDSLDFDIINGHEYDEDLRNIDYIRIPEEVLEEMRMTGGKEVIRISKGILDRKYMYDSDEDYVIKTQPDETYATSSSLLVIFNKEVTQSTIKEITDDKSGKYNPEKTDGVWDENDWFYKDPTAHGNKNIGMHGENIWYYRNPLAGNTPQEDPYIAEPVGSGFIMQSTAYIGDTKFENGKKYYVSFDIETNFTGIMQVCLTADSSVATVSDRNYQVIKLEKQHIFQTFIANDIESPEWRFLIYNFDKYPIHRGDYVCISNLRVTKANSDNYIPKDIPSYDKLQEIYRTNTAIYKWLTKAMAEETDLYKYEILKKIYDSLMISNYNKEAFKIGENKYARTYTEFLQNRDTVLYSRLVRFKSLDPDAMRKEIADEIIEVSYAIDDCVNTYAYGYLYSYFPAISANYIQQYITKLINWFKSWKVHLLGINTVYKLADPNENTIKILEKNRPKNKYDFIKGNVYIHDSVKINPIDTNNISGYSYKNLYGEEMGLYQFENDRYSDFISHMYNDSYNIHHRIRVISRMGNTIEYKDPENNIVLRFNDDDVKSIDDNGTLRISSSKAGFATANQNDMIMNTNESPEIDFAHQIVDEINLYSGDYIDWQIILDDDTMI